MAAAPDLVRDPPSRPDLMSLQIVHKPTTPLWRDRRAGDRRRRLKHLRRAAGDVPSRPLGGTCTFPSPSVPVATPPVAPEAIGTTVIEKTRPPAATTGAPVVEETETTTPGGEGGAGRPTACASGRKPNRIITGADFASAGAGAVPRHHRGRAGAIRQAARARAAAGAQERGRTPAAAVTRSPGWSAGRPSSAIR
jgi:hypothetical protein